MTCKALAALERLLLYVTDEAAFEAKYGGPEFHDSSVSVEAWLDKEVRGPARAAIRDHPDDDYSRREALLVALDELFDCDIRSIPPDEWATAQEAFKAAQSELQCPDGCDTSCPCWQEGHEAPREPVGGGTA